MAPWFGKRAVTAVAALCCALTLAVTAVQAATSEPERLVSQLTAAVIDEIKAKRVELRGARATATGIDITTRLIAPHVDFATLARRATGSAWDAAAAEQRAAIEAHFRILLVHVAAKLLAGYNDELLAVEPLTLAPDATQAEVHIKVTATRNTGDEPPEPMFVSLAKRDGNSGAQGVNPDQWRIVDVRAEGISLVKLYAGNFAAVLARGEGLDNLITLLIQRNKLNAQQLAPRD